MSFKSWRKNIHDYDKSSPNLEPKGNDVQLN
jgi:hypothetical protein